MSIVVASLFAVFCIFLIGVWYPATTSYPDSDWYIKIAEGNIKDVPQPFASRVLDPLIVRLLSVSSGLDIDTSFYVVNALFLTGFVFALSLLFLSVSFMSPLLAFSIVFVPFLFEFHRNFYMSDILSGFLIVLFLLFLKEKKNSLSLFLLFLLFFSRPTDATVLGVILVAVSFYKKEIQLARAGSAVFLISYLLSSQIITPLGAPNIHNISNFIYRVVEPPYYFVRNILGIDWFVSAHVQYCQPKLLLSLPQWIQMGNLKTIGICGFNIFNPLSVILYALTTFGLIPGILFFALRKNVRALFSKSETWLLVAICYGVLLFLLGSLVPNLRTVSYGWPVFLLSSFFIFDAQTKQWPAKAKEYLIKIFVPMQIILLWTPYLIVKNLSYAHETLKFSLSLSLAVVFYAIFIKICSIVVKKYNLVYNL